MPRYVDIEELTRAVLESVADAEHVVKTAEATEGPKTEVGTALKAAAEKIRNCDDSEVTREDLKKLGVLAAAIPALAGGTASKLTGGGFMEGAGKAMGTLAGIPLGPMGMYGGHQLGGAVGRAIGGSPQQQQPQQAVQNPAAGAAKMGSVLGAELRKIAAEIRKQGDANEKVRLTKAAQMLTAAVGLKHLTEGLSK